MKLTEHVSWVLPPEAHPRLLLPKVCIRVFVVQTGKRRGFQITRAFYHRKVSQPFHLSYNRIMNHCELHPLKVSGIYKKTPGHGKIWVFMLHAAQLNWREREGWHCNRDLKALVLFDNNNNEWIIKLSYWVSIQSGFSFVAQWIIMNSKCNE